MEAINTAVKSKHEQLNNQDAIDSLIDEFPEELHDKLFADIEEFDDYTARDFLTSKLIDRKIALLPPEYSEIPKHMEVVSENPEVIQESLEKAHEAGSEYFLGAGQNGEVIASTRQEGICYKTLFLERAQEIGANVAREALMQHNSRAALETSGLAKSIPEVQGFVRNVDVQAIKMEQINGHSLKQVMENPTVYRLPAAFDLDTFFEKLEEVVEKLNELGYFHRDLHGNAGNVLVTNTGEPVLVDFGSAVRATNFDPDEKTYEIVPGGHRYRKNDIDGVRDLKARFQSFLAKAE